jgi:hypothetical protein
MKRESEHPGKELKGQRKGCSSLGHHHGMECLIQLWENVRLPPGVGLPELEQEGPGTAVPVSWENRQVGLQW